MSIKESKIKEIISLRYLYIVLSLIIVYNLIVFPFLSLFPFQWLLLLVSVIAYTMVKNIPIRRFSVIIMVFLSIAMLVMDVLGCLYLWQDVILRSMLIGLSVISVVNTFFCIKLLIDQMVKSSIK